MTHPGQTSLMSQRNIEQSAALVEAQPVVARQSRRPSPVVWLMLGILVLLALAVIFVLPGVVEEYELPFTPRTATETVPVAPVTTSSLPAISPFEEAQRARQRAEAQDVLASLLERQNALVALNVESWAQSEYAAAVESARLGDEAYRSQQFDEAAAHYRRTDSALQALQESLPQGYQDAMAAGAAALQAGDATQALESFRLALLMSPADDDAQAGLARAENLPQVLALMDEASSLSASGELQEARSRLEQALAVDPEHPQARRQLDELTARIADNAFTTVMSQGFAALQEGSADNAIAAFERALSMRPDSREARAAIDQTRDQLDVSQISRHRSSAEAYEAQENWASAMAEYDAVLAIDPNLVFAVEGRDHAARRQQLDTLLQQAIDQPQRLADEAVHAQALQVYYTGAQLAEPGPRLQQQLAQLEQLLLAAQVPVDVQLISDNATEVTVYQVGVLGQFERHTLSLTPGRYVAVGTRPGYRDVREEFVVGLDGSSTPVTISCTEAVAVNGR